VDGEWREKTVPAESIPEGTVEDRQGSAPKQEDQTPEERIRIEHASGGDTQAMPVSGETALETEGTGAARPSGRDERDPDDLPAAPPEAGT
jgi:hypothetical protein